MNIDDSIRRTERPLKRLADIKELETQIARLARELRSLRRQEVAYRQAQMVQAYVSSNLPKEEDWE